MLESFSVIGTQVSIIYILIIVGYICGKCGFVTAKGVESLNNIMLYIVCPCVMVNAFQMEFAPELMTNLFLSIIIAFLYHALCAILAFLLVKNKDNNKQTVLRFAVVFSNCSFMALPLLDALLGKEGLFYGAGYIAVFNIIVWTIGQYAMAQGEDGLTPIKAILNPTIIGIIIGLVLFFTSVELPEIIAKPLSYMSVLNTPIPMLIIGYTISTFELKKLIDIREEAVCLVLRLVVAPVILLAAMYMCGIRGALLISTTISASAPVAAMTTMFAIKFRRDEKLASKIVVLSSLLSLVTITIVVGVAKYLAY